MGDGDSETDYGYNAHDEILEIVEKIFKKFNLDIKKEISILKENNLFKEYKKSKKCLYLYINSANGLTSRNFITLNVKTYDKITNEYVLFKGFIENEKFYKDEKYKYLSKTDNIFILPIDDSLELIKKLKDNKKIKIYDFIFDPSYKETKSYNIDFIKKEKETDYEAIQGEYSSRGKTITNENLDELIKELQS